MKASIDKDLLPMKAHYFLFNAGKVFYGILTNLIQITTGTLNKLDLLIRVEYITDKKLTHHLVKV